MVKRKPTPRARSTRRRWIALGALALLAAVGVGVYLVCSPAKEEVEPPAPDLTGVDPAVSDLIADAQAQVRKSPKSGGAWGRLGLALHTHIFGNEALVCFARAEQLDPNNPRWPYFQALIHLAHDPPAALPKLRRAVELCRDETDGPRLRLAELYLRLGQEDEAREQFRGLSRSSSPHPRAHLGLARLAFQNGDLVASREHLKPALAFD